MNNKQITCRIEGCASEVRSKGACGKHYQRERLGIADVTSYDNRPAIIEGDIAKIPLGVAAKQGYAIVDKEYAYLADEYKWTKDSLGYAATTTGSPKRLHKIILNSNSLTDHINNDRLDNRIANLRRVSHSENMQNSKPRSSSGYKGVSATRNGNKWRAYIKPFKKQLNLGIYDTKEAAAVAYNSAAEKFFGEYAYINKVIK